MRVLSLVNQKGGCGKTTAAINLAAALCALGSRVLVVDLDPQAHASLGLSHDSDSGPSVADVLLGERALDACIAPAPGGIALLPGSQRLAEFEESAAREIAPQQRLREALRGVASRFDFALLDCPARADGLLTTSALVASDLAVLVIETGAFALQGAVRALRLLQAAGARHDADFELMVLATLFDRRTRFARELLIALHARFGARMFDTAIRNHVRLREAAGYGVPVRVLDPRSAAAGEFDHWAAEVLALPAREPLEGHEQQQLPGHLAGNRSGVADGAPRAELIPRARPAAAAPGADPHGSSGAPRLAPRPELT